MATIRNKSMVLYLGAIALVLVAIAASVVALSIERRSPEKTAVIEKTEQGALHPVHIRGAAGPPRIATGETDFQGRPVTVACSTCHATTTPNVDIRSSEQLDEFHLGLKFNHGELSCLSCHNANNYDTLRLADGRSVQFQDVQQLCAQCHGPQTRDYRNGSHGGMTGHWDLARGSRTRNNCTDCHDPHAPQFPTMMPVFHPVPAGKVSESKH